MASSLSVTNLVNDRDRSRQPRWLRVGVREERLGSRLFGHSTRGRNGIGTRVDLSVSVQAHEHLTPAGYYAPVFGCGMIDQAFAGNDAGHVYLEAPLSF